MDTGDRRDLLFERVRGGPIRHHVDIRRIDPKQPAQLRGVTSKQPNGATHAEIELVAKRKIMAYHLIQPGHLQPCARQWGLRLYGVLHRHGLLA